MIDDLFETVPPGLQVPSPEIVRHFSKWSMGEAFRMEGSESGGNNERQFLDELATIS